jgi:DNA primase
VKKALKKRLSEEKKRQDRKEHSAAVNMQPGDRTIRYDNVYSAAAEEGVLHLLISDDALFETLDKLEFREDEFTSPFLLKTFLIISSRHNEGLEITPAAVLSELDGAEASQLTRMLDRPQSLTNAETAMRDYIEKIRSEKLKRTAREDPMALLLKYRDQPGCGGNQIG